jgi:hypothetical protein
MPMMRAAAFAFLVIAASGCATSGAPGPRPGPVTAGKPLPGKPAFRAEDIAGLTSAGLDALLGPADLTRIEGAGEFRRYTLAECALLIILYPDDKGEKRARQLDAGALTSGTEKPDLARCLAVGKAD